MLLRQGYLLRVHELGGFASFREYVERVFGFTGRQTEERLRVAEALEALPALSTALDRGELSWSAVRELTRVATADTEDVWIAEARPLTAREVAKRVSGRTLGELLDGPSRPEAETRRITVTVSASTHALWQEARRQLIRETGGSVDDETVLMMLARRFLGGPDEGRSNYQIAITACDACGHATQRAGADDVTVDEVTMGTAACDAQQLGRLDGAKPTRAAQAIPPAVRRAVIVRHGRKCAAPGCRHAAFLDLHHTAPRAEGGTHDPELLCPLCPAHHRAVHRGALVVRGSYGAGFVFEHADGRRYGHASSTPAQAEAFTQAFEALRALSFKDTEARQMLDAVRPHVGAEVVMPALLYEVLRRAPAATCVRERTVAYVRAAA